MSDLDFKAVTDRLALPAEELAARLGVSVQSVRQMRSHPDSAAYRSPPLGWERKLGPLARQRALELLRIANDLHHAAG